MTLYLGWPSIVVALLVENSRYAFLALPGLHCHICAPALMLVGGNILLTSFDSRKSKYGNGEYVKIIMHRAVGTYLHRLLLVPSFSLSFSFSLFLPITPAVPHILWSKFSLHFPLERKQNNKKMGYVSRVLPSVYLILWSNVFPPNAWTICVWFWLFGEGFFNLLANLLAFRLRWHERLHKSLPAFARDFLGTVPFRPSIVCTGVCVSLCACVWDVRNRKDKHTFAKYDPTER